MAIGDGYSRMRQKLFVPIPSLVSSDMRVALPIGMRHSAAWRLYFQRRNGHRAIDQLPDNVPRDVNFLHVWVCGHTLCNRGCDSLRISCFNGND